MSQLQLVILGLTAKRPMSGYAIRMAFKNSPLRQFGASPGAIYPALQRLISMGLIVRSQSAGGRRSYVYEPTSSGDLVLCEWLAKTGCDHEGVCFSEQFLIRYAFFGRLKVEQALQQIDAFIDATERAERELEAWLQASDEPEHFTFFAIRHGILAHRTSRQWAIDARLALISKRKNT